MSLLLEDHLIEVTVKDKKLIKKQTCWKYLSCSKVLCPAHGKESVECWLIPRTHCAEDVKDDFFQKISSCISCTYFKKQGELHPKGWHFFLTDQIRQYNAMALEHIYQKEESFVEIFRTDSSPPMKNGVLLTSTRRPKKLPVFRPMMQWECTVKMCSKTRSASLTVP